MKEKKLLVFFACVALTACSHSKESSENNSDSDCIEAVEEVVDYSVYDTSQEVLAAENTEVEQEEVVKKEIGNWTLNDSQYVSPVIKEDNNKANSNIKFILSKGKIEVVFSERIEADYDMKLIENDVERSLTGSRSGKTFTISSSNEISVLLAAMDRGNFTFEYMFSEEGARHYGWYDFKVGSQLRSATEAYRSLN